MKKPDLALVVEIIIIAAILGVSCFTIGYRKGMIAGKKEATEQILKLADQMLNEQLDGVDQEVLSPEQEVNRIVEEPHDLGSTNIQSVGDGQGS